MNMPSAYNPSSTANHRPHTDWSIVLPCMCLIFQGHYTALWSSFRLIYFVFHHNTHMHHMYSRPHIFHIPSLLFVHMSPCRVRVPPLMKALDRLKSLLNECLLVHLHSNSSLFCPHTQSCQCQSTLQHNKPLWIHMSRQTVHAYWVVTLNYRSQFSLQRGWLHSSPKDTPITRKITVTDSPNILPRIHDEMCTSESV